MVFDEGKGLSTAEQQYDPTPIINEIRQHVDQWRAWPNPSEWQVTPETARLLQHCLGELIFLGKRPDLAEFAGLPFGTIVRGHCDPYELRVISGPAWFQRGEWALPCYWFCGHNGIAWARSKANALRRSLGREPRS